MCATLPASPPATTNDTPSTKLQSKVPADNFELEIAAKDLKSNVFETKANITKDANGDDIPDDGGYALFRYPKERSSWRQAMWIVIWPIHLLFVLTIPNCEERRFKNLFPLTFLMCIVWIGSLSYLVAWMITIVGMLVKTK